MNFKPVALTLIATALLTPAAAFASEPAASFERAFNQPAETPRAAAPAVYAGEAADALTVAFNQALWTRQAPTQYTSTAPVLASFERVFSQSAETPREAAPAVYAGEAADALTVAFNQVLWTRQAPAQYASTAPVLASFERVFSQSAETPRAAAPAVYAGEAADALTVAFNQALWTKQAPAPLPRYVSSTTAQETKRN